MVCITPVFDEFRCGEYSCASAPSGVCLLREWANFEGEYF